MKALSFEIPGKPVAKGRARAFKRGNLIGHYTPQKTRTHEGVVATLAMHAMRGRSPLNGPIILHVRFVLSIPKAWPRWKSEMAHRGEILPTAKPDIDNLVKAVKDGLNGVVWNDDAQVISLTTVKEYGDRSFTAVTIRQVSAQPAQIKSKVEAQRD